MVGESVTGPVGGEEQRSTIVEAVEARGSSKRSR